MIRAKDIPVPARDRRCSRCGCPWTMTLGIPSLRDVLCDRFHCPCHSPAWSAALYEGSALDLDQLTSSGAQE